MGTQPFCTTGFDGADEGRCGLRKRGSVSWVRLAAWQSRGGYLKTIAAFRFCLVKGIVGTPEQCLYVESTGG